MHNRFTIIENTGSCCPRLHDKTERLFAEVIEVLRLKLRILFSLINSLDIYLYLSKIFFSS